MGKYAEGTGVSEDQSQLEIKRIIARYGGDLPTFGWGRDEYTAVVGFRHSGRYIRFDIALPRPEEIESHRYRTAAQQAAAVQAERRRRWRVAVLRLKAKFEAMQEGVSLDEEFMPYIMLPEGGTVGQRVMPLLEQAYLTGRTPQLMLGIGQEANS